MRTKKFLSVVENGGQLVGGCSEKELTAYTADSCANLETELAESVELLSRETLYKAAALEQVTHLTEAVQNLKAA